MLIRGIETSPSDFFMLDGRESVAFNCLVPPLFLFRCLLPEHRLEPPENLCAGVLRRSAVAFLRIGGGRFFLG